MKLRLSSWIIFCILLFLSDHRLVYAMNEVKEELDFNTKFQVDGAKDGIGMEMIELPFFSVRKKDRAVDLQSSHPDVSLIIMGKDVSDQIRDTCEFDISALLDFRSPILNVKVNTGKNKIRLKLHASDIMDLDFSPLDWNGIIWKPYLFEPLAKHEGYAELVVTQSNERITVFSTLLTRMFKLEFEIGDEQSPGCFIFKQTLDPWSNEQKLFPIKFDPLEDFIDKVHIRHKPSDFNSIEESQIQNELRADEITERNFNLTLQIVPKPYLLPTARCYWSVEPTPSHYLPLSTLNAMLSNALLHPTSLNIPIKFNISSVKAHEPQFLPMICIAYKKNVQFELKIQPQYPIENRKVKFRFSFLPKKFKPPISPNSLIPTQLKPSEVLNQFVINGIDVLETLLNGASSTIEFDWTLAISENPDFSLLFSPGLKDNVTNFSLLVKTLLLPKANENNLANTVESSETYYCSIHSCLPYRFKNEMIAGLKYAQDLYNRTLEVQFTLFNGIGKADWSVVVHPKISKENYERHIYESPGGIWGLFDEIKLNNVSLDYTYLKYFQKSQHGVLMNLIYDTPMMELQFKIKEHIDGTAKYYFQETVKLTVSILNPQLGPFVELKTDFSTEPYLFSLSPISFNGRNQCKDWDRKEFLIDLYSVSPSGGPYFGNTRVRFQVPFILRNEICSLQSTTMDQRFFSKNEIKTIKTRERNYLLGEFHSAAQNIDSMRKLSDFITKANGEITVDEKKFNETCLAMRSHTRFMKIYGNKLESYIQRNVPNPFSLLFHACLYAQLPGLKNAEQDDLINEAMQLTLEAKLNTIEDLSNQSHDEFQKNLLKIQDQLKRSNTTYANDLKNLDTRMNEALNNFRSKLIEYEDRFVVIEQDFAFQRRNPPIKSSYLLQFLKEKLKIAMEVTEVYIARKKLELEGETVQKLLKKRYERVEAEMEVEKRRALIEFEKAKAHFELEIKKIQIENDPNQGKIQHKTKLAETEYQEKLTLLELKKQEVEKEYNKRQSSLEEENNKLLAETKKKMLSFKKELTIARLQYEKRIDPIRIQDDLEELRKGLESQQIPIQYDDPLDILMEIKNLKNPFDNSLINQGQGFDDSQQSLGQRNKDLTRVHQTLHASLPIDNINTVTKCPQLRMEAKGCPEFGGKATDYCKKIMEDIKAFCEK